MDAWQKIPPSSVQGWMQPSSAMTVLLVYADPAHLVSWPTVLWVCFPSLPLRCAVMDLLWVLSVSMLTACVAIPMDAAAGSHSLFTCEPITLRMCQGLPYNSTFMPNALNHYDQQTAALAMEVQYAADVWKMCCGLCSWNTRLCGGEQLIFAEDLSGAFLFLKGMELKKLAYIWFFVVVVALRMSSIFVWLLFFVCVFLWPTFLKNFSLLIQSG